MSRSGTREQNTGQPSVEEMLVSIRKAIHGDNAKAASKNNGRKVAAKPVSGSMRQTRVSLTGAAPTRVNPGAQASIHTHSNNFQKLKKQLHDLDPLLGRQGKKRVAEDRARAPVNGSRNGFAGILNGDIKLEEALAKLERAGLGEQQETPSHAEPLNVQEPVQLRGVETDDYDEYDFDQQTYEVEAQHPAQETYLAPPELPEIRQSDYMDDEPVYIQRSIEPEPAAVLPVAPPVASAPLAPPPVPRQPSYGYLEEPQRPVRQAPHQAYEDSYRESVVADRPQMPLAPIQQSMPPAIPPAMPQMIANQGLTQSPTHLTSPQNAQAASDAFATLAETIVHQASVGNRSIDELTKELLHPMLKGWLDENLPRMVERLIREEIERVARGGARS